MLQVQENVSLADYTSWQVGGVADFFCLPKTIEEVEEAVRFALSRGIPFTVLGGGSNVLVSDRGVEGLVICMRKFSGVVASLNEGSIRSADAAFASDAVSVRPSVSSDSSEPVTLSLDCLAGTGKSELLKIFLKHKMEPALFLAGLPGDVGGGVVMNAGVAEAMKPREFFEIVDEVEVLKVENGNLRRQVFSRDEIHWSYRHSNGWQPGIVIRARLSWTGRPDADILNKVREANRLRLSKQPLDLPSCGSVFVNPPGHKAAQLVDGCGLKGFQVGGAQVSLKHANFIVNLGGATARDILSVIEHVRQTVKAKTGVELTTEVVSVGRPL